MARPGYFKKTFTINGKQYTAYGHDHDEAVAKAALKKAEIEGKLKTQEVARKNYTVEKWSNEWLEKYKKGTTGEAWYKSIEGIVNNYINPSIGDMMIKDVRPADLNALLNANTNLSVSHGKKILQILRQIFDAAEDNNLIVKNPAQRLKLPKTYQDKVPRRSITDEERALTINTAEKYPDEGLFFLIMLYCGCRPQEVSRLLYGDYNKNTRTLHVQRARKASGETGTTKSQSGDRYIPVPDVLADKLDEHEGASAVIVSHDMYLAMTFADVIVKIRKGTRPRQDSNDEEVTYGIIDQDCVFMPTADRSVWSNGRERFATAEFEEYLRKK